MQLVFPLSNELKFLGIFELSTDEMFTGSFWASQLIQVLSLFRDTVFVSFSSLYNGASLYLGNRNSASFFF